MTGVSILLDSIPPTWGLRGWEGVTDFKTRKNVLKNSANHATDLFDLTHILYIWRTASEKLRSFFSGHGMTKSSQGFSRGAYDDLICQNTRMFFLPH